MTVNQKALQAVLNYNPENGFFTWLPSSHPRRKGRAGWVSVAGYRYIQINGRSYCEHRLAFLYMTGCWPSNYIDHINRVKSDNKWANLREATNLENQGNADLAKHNSSGLRGVTWCKRDKKWRAQICINNKMRSIGRFQTMEEANIAYLAAAKEHFGPFAPSEPVIPARKCIGLSRR